MATWKREPEETPGDQRFRGRAYMTRGVSTSLSPTEVMQLELRLQADVEENNGLDYLQVFTSDDGRKVWVIDDGPHHTWLLPSEY